MNPSQWPRTVDAAVNVLLAKLSKEHKAETRDMTKDGLILGCHDLRIHIKNQWGILQNEPLLENGGKKFDPDGAVAVIIETLWRRSQREPHEEGGADGPSLWHGHVDQEQLRPVVPSWFTPR